MGNKLEFLFLFDIDGTILRLKQYRSKQIFRKALAELFNFDISESEMPNFSGMTDLQILQDICIIADYPFSKIEHRIDDLWSNLLLKFDNEVIRDNIVLLPSVDMMISNLCNIENTKLALVTGNFRDNAYLKLDAYNLSKYFPVGAFGCDYADRNKLPNLAIQRANSHWSANFSNRNSIIIGDSPNDIICAKSNNILSVAVCTGFHSADELEYYKPDLIFENFNDYEAKIETILNKI